MAGPTALGVVFYVGGRTTREHLVRISFEDEVHHDMSHIAQVTPEG